MTPGEILAALTGLQALFGVVERAIAAGKERGEWTPEQEAEFDAKVAEIVSRDHWKRVD